MTLGLLEVPARHLSDVGPVDPCVLGIDPTPTLADLEERILLQDLELVYRGVPGRLQG